MKLTDEELKNHRFTVSPLTKPLLDHIDYLTEKLTDRETRLRENQTSYMELQRKYYLLEQGLCRANQLLEKMEVSHDS